jgi:hypothetical protein
MVIESQPQSSEVGSYNGLSNMAVSKHFTGRQTATEGRNGGLNVESVDAATSGHPYVGINET